MEIKLYKSPWRAIKLIFLVSVFVVPSIYFLRDPTFTDRWVCWMSISFFGLGYPVALFHLFDRRPQIIINETGIFDRTAFRDYINWDIIHDVYLVDVSRQKFICLVIDEKIDLSTKINPRLIKLNKALGFQEINISLGQIKIDEVRFAQFIIEMSMADRSTRNELMKQLNA